MHTAESHSETCHAVFHLLQATLCPAFIRGLFSSCGLQVNKGVLLLYVEPTDDGLPPVSADSMDILERVSVTEVEVTRFNPNRHREDWDPNE